jgi:PII-like signaling protein
MKLEGEQVLLRVYLRNTDKHGLVFAGDALLACARAQGLAGSTVFRGALGLHFTGEMLETRSWSLVEHTPLIVEIVDRADVIGGFLSNVDQVVPECLATLERAHVLVYRHGRTSAADARRRIVLPHPIVDLSTLPTAAEFPIMRSSEDGQMLRVFIGESDLWQGEPLSRAIIHKAKELGLAGATVLHGCMGFGANSRVHSAKLLDISTDLPVVIEIVDSADKIQSLLPFLDEVVQEGLVTIEAVRMLKLLANRQRESQPTN